MIRDKIQKIVENISKFELVIYHKGNSYTQYNFRFKETKIGFSIYGFPFMSESNLYFENKKIDLFNKEESFLLKAFKPRMKTWKKENKRIVHFDIDKKKQQNELLNSIDLK